VGFEMQNMFDKGECFPLELLDKLRLCFLVFKFRRRRAKKKQFNENASHLDTSITTA